DPGRVAGAMDDAGADPPAEVREDPPAVRAEGGAEGTHAGRGRRGPALAYRLQPGRPAATDRPGDRSRDLLRPGTGVPSQRSAHQGRGLRRAGGGDRGSADAQGPLHGQARGRARQGQAHGEDPAKGGMTGARDAAMTRPGASFPGVRQRIDPMANEAAPKATSGKKPPGAADSHKVIADWIDEAMPGLQPVVKKLD